MRIKFVTLLLVACLILLNTISVLAQTSVPPPNFSEPNAGLITNPYHIETWENLYWLTQTQSAWGNHFIQISDIDLADGDIENWDSGIGWTPIGFHSTPFTGVFDGKNYTISNLYSNRSTFIQHFGMFGALGNGAVVRNTKLDNVSIEVNAGALGALAGLMSSNSRVEKASVHGNIISTYTDGNALVGGIAGYAAEAQITQARAEINITVNQNYAGGLVGYLDRSTLADSFARGSITGNNDAGNLGGALGGQGGATGNFAVVARVYARVEIITTGTGYFNGFSGLQTTSNVNIANNYFWQQPDSPNSNLATPLTDAQLQQPNSFIDWNFNIVWQETDINNNEGYVDLQWYYRGPVPFISLTPPANFDDADAGTQANPLQISNWQELYWLSQSPDHWDKLYIQTADIDLNDGEIRNWDDYRGWTPIGNILGGFSGGYDGQGHVIRNLYMNRNVQIEQASGLFGMVVYDGGAYGVYGRIANLIVEDAEISIDGSYVGGVVGRLFTDAIIENVAFSGSVTSLRTGGTNPIIVGGIVGISENGLIRESRADAQINSGSGEKGAFAGRLQGGNYHNNIAFGTIGAGGFRGGFSGTFSGNSNNPINISDNVAIVEIVGTGQSIGGFSTSIGPFTTGYTIERNFALDGDYNGIQHEVTYLSEAEMKSAENFTGLDLDDTWFVSPTFNDGFIDLKWYIEAIDPDALVIDPFIALFEAPENFGTPDAGTSVNPYEITNWQQLMWIMANEDQVASPNRITRWGAHYVLTSDIDFNDATIDIETWNDGKGWLPIGNNMVGYFGVFEGNGHTVSNLYQNNTEDRHAGFFGVVDNNGQVRNLHVSGFVSGNAELGAPLGATGGLIGEMKDNALLYRSSFSGTVESVANSSSRTGGLVGLIFSGTVEESFAIVEISGAQIVGGLVGNNGGIIKESYVRGNMTAVNISGGIVGINNMGTIENSYAEMQVTTTDAGSISDAIGAVEQGSTFTNTFYLQSDPNDTETPGITGLTASEIKKSSNFTGFNFGNIWRQYPDFNDGLPYLDYQRAGSDVELDVVYERGWQLLSVPVNGLSLQRLAFENLVQGIPGVNAIYDDGEEYETGVASNMYLFDAATQEYVTPADMDHDFESGSGFIWFMYDNDIGPSKNLPFEIWLPDTADEDAQTVVELESGWNMIGNPYLSRIDLQTGFVGRVSGGNLASNMSMAWDAESSTWYQATSVEPLQGFFVDNLDADDFTFDADMKISPILADEGQEETAEFKTLAFELRSGNLLDRSASVIFHEEATESWDIWDARKLNPLSNSWVTLSFEGERNGELVRKTRNSLPLHLAGEVRIPLFVEAQNAEEVLSLSWSDLDSYPESWQFTMVNLENGETVDLRETKNITFENLTDVNQPQFELVVTNGETTSAGFENDLPTVFALNQNYPNPFNPTTVLSFDLPESGLISLRIYDTLGRQVATLLHGEMAAGRHSVNFDASHLASGMYIYRLQTGTKILTRSMTLIK